MPRSAAFSLELTFLSQHVLGKPLIAEMHARGEQLDEFIRRFQRYKPQLSFEPGTPKVSFRHPHCLLQVLASRTLTCHAAFACWSAQFVQQVVQAGERERLTRMAEAERATRRAVSAEL